MSFGKWVKVKRITQNISQHVLAEKAFISTSYVSQIERDALNSSTGKRTRPDEDIVDAIAKALNADENEGRAAAGYAPKQTEYEPGFKDIPVIGVDHKGRIESTRTLEQELITHMSEDIREMKQLLTAVLAKMEEKE